MSDGTFPTRAAAFLASRLEFTPQLFAAHRIVRCWSRLHKSMRYMRVLGGA